MAPDSKIYAAPRRPRLPNLATNALPPGGLDAVAPALLRAALDQAHPGLAARLPPTPLAPPEALGLHLANPD